MRRQIRLPALLSGSDVIFLLLNKITKIDNVLMARSFREQGMSTQCLLLPPRYGVEHDNAQPTGGG